jgi:hypothetical protein
MYQVKGARNPAVIQVPVSGLSLNHGDAFVLASERYIFLWLGRTANSKEKQKAAILVDKLKVRFKTASSIRLEASATTPEFWETLGGQTEIANDVEGGDDASAEEVNARRIFKVEDSGFRLVAQGPTTNKGVLTGGGIFVIQRGQLIIVFLSRGTRKDEIERGPQIGADFRVSRQLPETSRVIVVREEFPSFDFEVAFE